MKVGFAAFCKELGRVGLAEECAPKRYKQVSVSGRDLREQLRAGQAPDPRIMRPETANILIEKPFFDPRLLGMIAGVVVVVAGLGAAGAYFLTRDSDGPWPEVPMAPLRNQENVIQEDVTMHIAGVTDDYTAGIITRKLARLADPPTNNGMITARKGDRLTARVTSTDPQASAKKIDFGTVRKVSGRIITVDVKPVEKPAENDEIGKALYDIRGPFAVPRREAYKRLKDLKPNARRDEVVKELTNVIPETEPEDRRFAIEALTAWGGKDDR